MTALLSAPWYFLAGFCLFGGVLLGVALWWLLCWAASKWPDDELNDPNYYCADDVRDPTKE